MKEFDYCPGCKAGLLLEAPDTDGKGLRCLDCGYTCETSEPQGGTLTGVRSEKEGERLAYWQRRCEAAESVIASRNIQDAGGDLSVYQAWLAVKAEGEPV